MSIERTMPSLLHHHLYSNLQSVNSHRKSVESIVNRYIYYMHYWCECSHHSFCRCFNLDHVTISFVEHEWHILPCIISSRHLLLATPPNQLVDHLLDICSRWSYWGHCFSIIHHFVLLYSKILSETLCICACACH